MITTSSTQRMQRNDSANEGYVKITRPFKRCLWPHWVMLILAKVTGTWCALTMDKYNVQKGKIVILSRDLLSPKKIIIILLIWITITFLLYENEKFFGSFWQEILKMFVTKILLLLFCEIFKKMLFSDF